ncbi:CybS-domain-containing protein [Kockovaella imperatae]|uniref:Succinate dehydrogenase [ubiquinone] cytochrome b small subunit n=1 Tax=Kockovaella imperatae TaxID=4999 RepID=A0A1Y1UQE8_9TREE|nr:CybS-domain-containing protein [Kockovaella imperatae]ORX39676.1 CybS-domain-containing protein [Kockovaella imperatae]
MSLLRQTPATLRTGLGSRSLHTSRVLSIRVSAPRRDATVSANETGGFKYVAGGPVLKGTVNDANTFPEPSKTHGSYHWAFERTLSAALIPILGGAVVTSGTAHPILDAVLALSLVVHSHIGFDASITDYFHPRKWPVVGPIMTWLLRLATGGVVWGLYEFNTNDIGLTELVRRLWTA